MAPPPIKIRIGAAVDQSVASVYADIEKRTRKLHSNIAKEQVRAAKTAEKETRRMGKGLGDSVTDGAKRADRALKDLGNSFKELSRVATRELNRQATAQRRAAEAQVRAQRRAAESFARRTSHRATRFLMPNAPLGSMARRAAGDLARGAGIRTDIASNVAASVSADAAARALSTAGFQHGAAGPEGKRVDPMVLKREARDLAKRYGVRGGTEGVLQGQHAFVEQRGNLAGARTLSEDLVKRAVGTGSSSEDVFRTAAKIDSALVSQEAFKDEGVRNKAILRLIDNFAKQGKIGSIEFEEAAKQVPKLSGIAASFTGDATKNLSQLMTVAQLAERGPAKNAATASTYAQNFALDISKRSSQFKKMAGVDIFDESGDKLSSLEDIIIGTIAGTEKSKTIKRRGKPDETINQIQQLQAILPNKRSFLALQEFLNVFKGAGGGEKGVAALREEFRRFGEEGSAEQVASDLANALGGTENKAERFNAKLEEISDKMLMDMLPAIEKLAPAVLTFVETASRATTWMVENPKKAIGMALAAAISRAAVESSLRAGIERMILGPHGGSAGRASKISGVTGALGSAAVIAALTVTTLTVGTMFLDDLADKSAKEDTRRAVTDADRALDAQAINRSVKSGSVSGDQIQRVKELIEENKKAQGGLAEDQGTGRAVLDSVLRALGTAGDFLGGDELKINETLDARDKREAERMEALKAENKELQRLLALIEIRLSGGINVNVNNMPAGGVPGTVDQGG